MKFLITSLLTVLSISAFSQNFISPNYKEGVYRVDTVFQYYGGFPNNGTGGLSLFQQLKDGVVTGVDFIAVVDSVNQGASPQHAAYLDSSGTLVPVFTGDTLKKFPLNFTLFSGEIGFRILLVGTPTRVDEAYPCELQMYFTLGDNWYLEIGADENNCTVDPILNTKKSIKSTVSLYPNPTTQFLKIEFQEEKSRVLSIRNNQGVEVERIAEVTSTTYMLDTQDLKAGYYLLFEKNGDAEKFISKFVVK